MTMELPDNARLLTAGDISIADEFRSVNVPQFRYAVLKISPHGVLIEDGCKPWDLLAACYERRGCGTSGWEPCYQVVPRDTDLDHLPLIERQRFCYCKEGQTHCGTCACGKPGHVRSLIMCTSTWCDACFARSMQEVTDED